MYTLALIVVNIYVVANYLSLLPIYLTSPNNGISIPIEENEKSQDKPSYKGIKLSKFLSVIEHY